MTDADDAKARCVQRVGEVLGVPPAPRGTDWILPDGRRLVAVYSRPQHGGRDFFVGLPNRLVATDVLIVLLGDDAVVFEDAGWLLAYAPYMSRSNDGRPNPRFRDPGNGLVLSVAKAGLEIAVAERTNRFDRLLRLDPSSDFQEPPLGQPFVLEDEAATSTRRSLPSVDLAQQDRATQGHRRTLNHLSAVLRAHGLEPSKPVVGEPRYDLAWRVDTTAFVAEVKSLTDSNEEQQLRLGLGQVLRYQQAFGDIGRQTTAVLAVERRPSDPSWVRLCAAVGVTLVWPDTFDALTSISG